MNIHVRFGSGLVLGNGLSRITVALYPSSGTMESSATVADLLKYLREQYPVAPLATAVAVINGEHVSLTTPLSDGQEVALLLPIAGG
ncbi:MAG: MoaD/ThiS family protein [Chloroflexi bacterium]|nr:MoaD/ThiS family protein [Chloroflexota bacterium]